MVGEQSNGSGNGRIGVTALASSLLLAFAALLIPTGADAGSDDGQGADRRRAGADLRIAGTASPDPSVVGQQITVTVDVTNNGPDTATLLSINASNIPDSLAVSDLADGCQFTEGDVKCNFDELAAGATQTITFVLTPSATGSFSIPISTGAAEDTNTSNNNGSVAFTVAGASRTLSVTKDGGGTVASSPAGISCGSDCSESYPEGTDVFLTATPDSDQRFVSWTGGGCDAVPGRICTVSVNADTSVKATFAPVPTDPPTAGLSVTPPTKRLPITYFDASGSLNATNLAYSITGGKNIGDISNFEISPESPFTGLRIKQPGTYTATLTATSPSGSSTTSESFIVPKTSTSTLDGRMPNLAASSYQRGLFEPPGTARLCIPRPEQQLVVGQIDLRGTCFISVLSSRDIPKPERDVAGEWFDSQLGNKCRPGSKTYDEKKCFSKAEWLGAFTTSEPLKFNGMTLRPRRGAVVAVFPNSGRIVSSNAKLSLTTDELGEIRPHNYGPLDLRVLTGNRSNDFRQQLFSFNPANLPSIGGFGLNGQMTLSLRRQGARRFTELGASIKLPDILKTAGGSAPSGGFTMTADNYTGLTLGDLSFFVPEAYIGPVRLSNLGFTYKSGGEPAASPPCGAKYWKATLEIFLVPTGGKGAGLSLAPPPERQGLAFCNGEFHSAGGTLHFGDPIPPPQVLPGVFLEDVGLDMQLNPTVFSGSATLSAEKIIRARGGLLAAFPSSRAPYTVLPTDGGSTLAGLAGRKLTTPTFAIGGSIGLVIPTDDTLDLASGYFVYSYPAYFEAAGSASFETFIFGISARGSFALNAATGRFNAGVEGDVCLAPGIRIKGISLCIGGSVTVSSRGMVGCLIVIDDAFEPGVGYHWGDATPHIFNGVTDGCKPSRYWELNIQSARAEAREMAAGARSKPTTLAARADDSLTFTVEKGDDAKDVELHGQGGAPAVQITAPDGETMTSVAGEMQHSDNLQVMQWEDYDMTWVGVTGAPGKYVVTPLPGSPPIQSLSETRFQKHDQIKAKVSGKGRDLELSYDVGDVKGRTVVFSEKSDGVYSAIGTAKSGKGTIKFEPAVGPAGPRQIVAAEDVDGIAAPEIVVDSYKAPGPLPAPKMKKVRAKRRGSKLLVSWGKVNSTNGYKIVATQLNGTQKSVWVSAKKSSARIKGLEKTQAGTVTVTALGAIGDLGKPKKVKFKYAKKPTDARSDFKDLGKDFTSPSKG